MVLICKQNPYYNPQETSRDTKTCHFLGPSLDALESRGDEHSVFVNLYLYVYAER